VANYLVGLGTHKKIEQQMFDVYADSLVWVLSIAKRRRKNLREKRNVFKWRLNMCSDGDDVTCAGDSPFQTRAAETGKGRSPTVQRRVGGTTSASIWWWRTKEQIVCHFSSLQHYLCRL